MSRYEEEDRFHSRKNPRLKQFDYRTPNCYFVTICTYGKECLFGTPDELNCFGQTAERKLQEIQLHFPDVVVDKYVVMPNHIHAMIMMDGKSELSTVVGLYKAAVTRAVRSVDSGKQVWQASFHDHIIRNQTDYERIWAYIDTNPARWMDDCFYTP